MRIEFHRPLVVCVFVALASASARADRTITASELFDKVHGMWVGQLIGNAAGRATEGVYAGSQPNPNSAVPWEIKQVWDADDDTDIEYIALHILESCGFECDPCEIAEHWLDHIAGNDIYIANKQAWYLMLDGYLPPDTGSRAFNQHWYAIDAQIGTEVLGAVSPGLPQEAIDLAGRFARITNGGFAVHAAQFYAALYAEAFFEPNVVELVSEGLAALPQSSRTAQVVRDVRDWYQQDAADGALDWRATRGRLYENYRGAASHGRYYNWVESTINVGATVLALLYGQGDFKEAVQIAVLAGWDCDCNPATAGGLLGIVHGFDALPPDLTDPAICGDLYLNVSRPGLPDPAGELPQLDTITYTALRMLFLAHQNVLRSGGYFTSAGRTRIYHVPEPEPLVIDTEKPDPIGPSGLVGQAIAAGITVAPRASVERFDENTDRNNLYSIMDGVTDNSHNGHKPYYTYVSDPAARPKYDWYELAFSGLVQFERLTFYEGDIVWAKINSYYREDQPLGGFFEDLTVQVFCDGAYVEPKGVQMSAELDQFEMYQTITFSFAPIVGEAIRIIGTPGGSREFTTILELEVDGTLYTGPDAEQAETGDATAPTSRQ